MEVPTAEDHPLAFMVVQRAARADHKYPNGTLPGVGEETRKSFWNGLHRDGYECRDETIAPIQEATAVPKPPAPTANRQSWTEILRRAKEAGQAAAPAIATPMVPIQNVFIVHGRDDAAKNEVARFVERLGLGAIILHEQPNAGKTLIAKFQEFASDVKFAIVLMTPDDVGGLDGSPQRKRARQNVIFELGFFIGRLGAEKSVCVGQRRNRETI